MQLVVTEAASSVAYHLLQLLGNGDVIPNHEKLHIVLCDGQDNLDVIEGVAMEIQDCLFPQVSSISTSCDFCDVFQTADLAIVLPSDGNRGNKNLQISYSVLQQRDFSSLDGALQQRSQDTLTVQAKGPMSTAVAIAGHIRSAYLSSIQVINLQQLPLLSSVQIFGCPGIEMGDEVMFNNNSTLKSTSGILCNVDNIVLVYALPTPSTQERKTGRQLEYYARL